MEWLIAAAAAYLLTRPRAAAGGVSEGLPYAETGETSPVGNGGLLQPISPLIPTSPGFDQDVERGFDPVLGTPPGAGSAGGSITGGPRVSLNIGGILNFIGGILNTISPALGPAAPAARIAGTVAVTIGRALPPPRQPLPVPAVSTSPIDRDPLEAGVGGGDPAGAEYQLEFSRGQVNLETGQGTVETISGTREFSFEPVDFSAPDAPEDTGEYYGGGGYAL